MMSGNQRFLFFFLRAVRPGTFIVPTPEMVLFYRVITAAVDFVIFLNVADYLSIKCNVNSTIPSDEGRTNKIP